MNSLLRQLALAHLRVVLRYGCRCGVVMRPVVVHCAVAGLNSSAVAKQLLLTLGPPPAPNTSAFGSGVAVANTRATDMLPVGFHFASGGIDKLGVCQRFSTACVSDSSCHQNLAGI